MRKLIYSMGVVLGGGTPYFPALDERINLELLETRTFGNRVVYVRYRRVDMAGKAGRHNVEVVRRFYDAWAQDDFPGPLELMDPDIEYVNPAEAVEPGTGRGVPAFAQAVEKLLQSWEFWRAEIEELRNVGDQVAVVVRYRTRGRGSGIDVEGRESALWTFRDGKVVRYEWFKRPSEALEAVGLREKI